MRHSFLHRVFSRTATAMACALALIVVPVRPAAAQLPPDPDSAQALEMRVEDGFTLGAVGDLLISRPVSQRADSRLTQLVRLLQRPDVSRRP